MTSEAFISEKSCLNCPSFVRAADTTDLAGKPLGAPMCARYAKPLGKPMMQPTEQARVAQKIAEGCDSYLQPKPSFPVRFDTRVTFPDMEAQERGRSIHDSRAKHPGSCNQCMFFVKDVDVQPELGWNAGLCRTKGLLVLKGRERTESRSCPYSVHGSNAFTTSGLQLIPVFMGMENPAVVEEVEAEREKFYIEPSEYPTDKEVSEEDRLAGVRAWRRVTDPIGGRNSIDLPIYDPDLLGLTDEERIKIPKTGSKEHPESYVDHNGAVYKIAVLWRGLDQVPALWGPAGVGKTEIFRHLAWLMQLPFERFSITASTELDDLAGKTHYSPEKGTFFTYGRLVKAWARPCVAVVDEPNVGQNDVWQFLRPMFDNSKQLVLDMNANESVDRGPAGYWGTAMNPAWDPRNVGTNTIGDADASRLFHLSMDLPPKEMEKRIIRDRVKLEDGWEIDDYTLERVMKIAKDIRERCKEGSLSISWGIRPQIQVARTLRWFDFPTAYLMVIGNYLEPEQRQILLDQVKAHT